MPSLLLPGEPRRERGVRDLQRERGEALKTAKDFRVGELKKKKGVGGCRGWE